MNIKKHASSRVSVNKFHALDVLSNTTFFKGIYGANQGKTLLNRNLALLKQLCGLTDIGPSMNNLNGPEMRIFLIRRISA